LLLDIDGVVCIRGVLIPGARELIEQICDIGINIIFITNCSLHKIHHFQEKIVPGRNFQIIDPIDVLRDITQKHSHMYKNDSIVIGTKEIRQKISDLGITIFNYKYSDRPDIVYIFEKLNYDQEDLIKISRFVLEGTKLYCAGLDRLFWYQGSVYPGVGAITEQIKYMTKVNYFVLGKPASPIFELAMNNDNNPEDTLCVGDDYEIDIIGASRCGLKTAFLTEQNTSELSKVNIHPDFIVRNLNELVEKIT